MSEFILPPSVTSFSVRPLEKVRREEAQGTLMDRVLVTPMKKSGRQSRRFISHSKPNSLYSLRHHSQRSSFSHAFAPYPKINLALNATVEDSPKTPRNKLRRTLSDRSYFINSDASETSTSVTMRRLIVDSHSPSKHKETRRLSKPNGMRTKPFKESMTTASSTLAFRGNPTYSEADPDLDAMMKANSGGPSTQDMDIALGFQALQLHDYNASPAVDLEHRSPSRKSDHECRVLDPLVTRLQAALAAEVKARNLAEQLLLREMKRRIEMEELVAQLQHERDELSLHQPSFTSSSPLLTSSSPCTSSKSIMNSSLP